MGNAGSNARERRKSGELGPPSPHKECLGQAFIFDKKTDKLVFQESNEEEEPYFTKDRSQQENETGLRRQKSSTASDGSENKVLPTVFKWEGGGKQVFISGTFSDWKPIPMVKSHADFVTIVDLPEGEHQYKYCVDGEWKYDPTVLMDNGLGTKNNLVIVKNSDFEVFQALDMDCENPSSSFPNAQSNEPDDYSQYIPTSIRPWEKVSGPPILPPHLLQVILNKDTPLSCEPTLLPEPNHVMLNHLYALSIKDGVMVLSATHRYRKKYVTTLLYKPI